MQKRGNMSGLVAPRKQVEGKCGVERSRHLGYRPRRKLEVWKKSMKFAEALYQVTHGFSKVRRSTFTSSVLPKGRSANSTQIEPSLRLKYIDPRVY